MACAAAVRRWTVSALAVGGSALAWSHPAAGQEQPVHWTVDAIRDTVQPGRWYTLKVRADIDAPWHLYSLTQPRPPVATVISVGPANLLRTQRAKQPRPARKYDPTFEITSELFEGKVAFEIPIAVQASITPGEHEGYVAVLYQACTDEVCLPPAEDTFAFVVRVGAPAAPVETVPGAASDAARPASSGDALATARQANQGGATQPGPAAAVPAGAPPDESDDSASFGIPGDSADAGAAPGAIAFGAGESEDRPGSAGGLLAFLGLAALMGGFALLTPCVFPMIPITVSYFTQRHRGGELAPSRTRIARDAMIYGGGIVLAFSTLGLVLALLFGATGINRFASNPWINLLVGALFVAFALDLLGAVEFRLPWRFVSALQGKSERDGLVGLLLMGVVFAVTTFTCTVPFVGTLLVAAAGGEWLRPLLGMLVFASVFALPFFLLALLPRTLHALPRSGSWMGALKFTLGLIELGAAFKFFSNADLVWQAGILSRPVVLAIWIGLSALIALYLLGQIKLTRDQTAGGALGIGVPRLLFGGAFLAFAVFLGSGLIGRPLGEVEAFLPPHPYPGREALASGPGIEDKADELTWFATYDEGLREARATNRPIFVDFTGYTCTNCRWMEQNVFRRADVQSLFREYVLVRLYTDGRGERYTRNRNMQLDRFGTVAMPLYAILEPDGRSVATLSGLTRKPEKFTNFLRTALNRSS